MVWHHGDIHRLRVKVTRHAAWRLRQRFAMTPEDLPWVLKSAKLLQAPRRMGDVGVLLALGGTMRVVFRLRRDELKVITVEEVRR